MGRNKKWNRLPHPLMDFINPDEAAKQVQVSFRNGGRQELINNRKLEEIAQLIYDRLVREGINYAKERFTLDEDYQDILSPTEIVSLKEGNCLDLSLLYCSLCHFYGLMSSVVLFHGHAIACVNKKETIKEHNVRKVNILIQENEGVVRGTKEDGYKEMARLYLESDDYIFIDCTGFSKYNSFSEYFPEGKNRNDSGLLDFKSSRIAGKNQFGESGRKFDYLVDLFYCIEVKGMGGHRKKESEKIFSMEKEEFIKKMDAILEMFHRRGFERYERAILEFLKGIKSDDVLISEFKSELRILGGRINRANRRYSMVEIAGDDYNVLINNYTKAVDTGHRNLKKDLLDILILE